MNENNKTIKSDLNRLDTLQDHEIDYSDIPALDDTFFNRIIIASAPFLKKNTTLNHDRNI